MCVHKLEVNLCFLLVQFYCPTQFLFWHHTKFKTNSNVAQDHLSPSIRGASLPKRFSCARLPAMIEATSCCIRRHGRLRMILCDSALAILWQKHKTSLSVRIEQMDILHLAAAIVAALQFYCRRRAATAIVHCQASLNNHGWGEHLVHL